MDKTSGPGFAGCTYNAAPGMDAYVVMSQMSPRWLLAPPLVVQSTDCALEQTSFQRLRRVAAD
eukprot:9024877-Ditylum_brightwellii.AAC.1